MSEQSLQEYKKRVDFDDFWLWPCKSVNNWWWWWWHWEGNKESGLNLVNVPRPLLLPKAVTFETWKSAFSLHMENVTFGLSVVTFIFQKNLFIARHINITLNLSYDFAGWWFCLSINSPESLKRLLQKKWNTCQRQKDIYTILWRRHRDVKIDFQH